MSALFLSALLNTALATEPNPESMSNSAQKEAAVQMHVSQLQEGAEQKSSKPSIRFNRSRSKDYTAQEKNWLQSNMKRYMNNSTKVVVATVIESRPMLTSQGKDLEIDVKVSEYMYGKGQQKLTLTVPFNYPYEIGKPETVPGVVVESYEMVIFIDEYNNVLDGNAMFVVEGGQAIRNKHPKVFISPSRDRTWEMESPVDNYIMFSIKSIRAHCENKKKFFLWKWLGVG